VVKKYLNFSWREREREKEREREREREREDQKKIDASDSARPTALRRKRATLQNDIKKTSVIGQKIMFGIGKSNLGILCTRLGPKHVWPF